MSRRPASPTISHRVQRGADREQQASQRGNGLCEDPEPADEALGFFAPTAFERGRTGKAAAVVASAKERLVHSRAVPRRRGDEHLNNRRVVRSEQTSKNLFSFG